MWTILFPNHTLVFPLNILVLSYFLILEVIIQCDVLWLNHQKYICELLHMYDLRSIKDCDIPINVGNGVSKQDVHILKDAIMYKSLFWGL